MKAALESVPKKNPAHFNWVPYRDAIDSVLPDFNAKLSESESQALWNFAVAVIDAYTEAGRPQCIGCKTVTHWERIYRCADCRALLCEKCIRPHFATTKPTTAHEIGKS